MLNHKNMIKKIVLLSFVLLFCGIKYSSAQNEMFKALFLYNFTKDIDWPETYKQGEFVVGVLGNSKIIAEIEKIGSKKKVGTQSIVVKKFTSNSDIVYCHVLYITPEKSSQLSEALTKLSDKPTLVITDKPGLADQGAGIN